MIEIPVYWGQEIATTAIVSPIDAGLRKYKWRTTPQGYIYRNTSRKKNGKKVCTRIYIHREIMGLEVGNPLCVHHKNSEPWDNRRENLEIVHNTQNNIYAWTTRKENIQKEAFANV